MADKPAWRTVFDQLMDEVGPRLSDATGSDAFLEAAEVAEAIRVRASSELQRNSRRALHSMNLPAGNDISIVRQEIGELTREVRALARSVEDLRDLVVATAAYDNPAADDATEADGEAD